MLNNFWHLRGQLGGEANLIPDESNDAERAEVVKRTSLPCPDNYDEKLAVMLACESLDMGLNEIHEAARSLYMMHKYT
jgi:hypothetical protein